MCKTDCNLMNNSFLTQFISSFSVKLSAVNPENGTDGYNRPSLLLRRNELQSSNVKPSEFMSRRSTSSSSSSSSASSGKHCTFPQLSFCPTTPSTVDENGERLPPTAQVSNPQMARKTALQSLSRPVPFGCNEIDAMSEKIAHNVASTLLILVKANIRRAFKYQCLHQMRLEGKSFAMSKAAFSCFGKRKNTPLLTLRSIAVNLSPSSSGLVDNDWRMEQVSLEAEERFSVPLKFSVKVEAEINEVDVNYTIASIGTIEGGHSERKIQHVDLRVNAEEFLMSLRNAAKEIASAFPILPKPAQPDEEEDGHNALPQTVTNIQKVERGHKQDQIITFHDTTPPESPTLISQSSDEVVTGGFVLTQPSQECAAAAAAATTAGDQKMKKKRSLNNVIVSRMPETTLNLPPKKRQCT